MLCASLSSYYPRLHSTRVEYQNLWTQFDNRHLAVCHTLIEPALLHLPARFIQAVKHESSIREAKKAEASKRSATLAVNTIYMTLGKESDGRSFFFNVLQGPKLDEFFEDTVLR